MSDTATDLPTRCDECQIRAPQSLKAAADSCLIGANHLMSLLGKRPPPVTADTAEAMRHYGPNNEAFSAWCAWRGIMRFRAAWDDWLKQADPAPAGTRASTMFRDEPAALGTIVTIALHQEPEDPLQ